MRTARPVLVTVVAAILFSTVYLSLHYIMDLIAGAVLGITVVAAVLAHERFTKRRQARARPRTVISVGCRAKRKFDASGEPSAMSAPVPGVNPRIDCRLGRN
jgi:membrane-associated phospholipid phosphatase